MRPARTRSFGPTPCAPSRPTTARLTEYYLLIAIGGAVGVNLIGIFLEWRLHAHGVQNPSAANASAARAWAAFSRRFSRMSRSISRSAVTRAEAAGATEICMQGGIHPDLPGTAYFDLARVEYHRHLGLLKLETDHEFAGIEPGRTYTLSVTATNGADLTSPDSAAPYVCTNTQTPVASFLPSPASKPGLWHLRNNA